MSDKEMWLKGYKDALEQVESLNIIVDPSVDSIFESHKQIVVSMLKATYKRNRSHKE